MINLIDNSQCDSLDLKVSQFLWELKLKLYRPVVREKKTNLKSSKLTFRLYKKMSL
jgi:hypothetical protein